MIVVVTAAAEADLEAIGDWIAKDSPARALTFILKLREACETLVDIPYAFALVPRYEDTQIRRRPHGNYLIFYRVSKDAIEILHVLHGARDYETILFPDT
jgi:plasmid stabilization system protein ParE